MNKKLLLVVLLLCVTFVSTTAQTVSLIPLPKQMQIGKSSYTLNRSLTIGYNDNNLLPAANYLRGILSKSTGYHFTIVNEKADLMLSLKSDSLAKESSYKLHIGKDGINISAADYKGIICGISTLRQLLPKEVEAKSVVRGKWNVPYIEISDEPAQEWRGLHLDVSRHFFSVKEVEEMLDLMALYKLNKFHWHLTDDQGWRIEIKKYPLLTEKGAWRKFNNQDRECMHLAKVNDNTDFLIPEDKLRIEKGDTLYGGYYTQDDIRNVVRYAQERGIDIIPEIDMPGHILCALQNYEGISCFPTTGWGETFSSPLCPGKESALEFCRNVYSEVCELFPYDYVHLGADEVEKANWKKCPDCQMRIKKLGLKDENELQSWFVRYMEAFLNSHNKRLLGWDEIVEGGLSKSATVTWWRGWAPEAVQHAFDQGNQVILCPTSFCYFDYQPDNNTLEKLYNGNLYDKPLTLEQENNIKGLQGNIWTERIPSNARLQYMTFPRALAIAEKGWTMKSQQNFESFSNRLQSQIDRLYYMGINYHPQELENIMSNNVFINKQSIVFDCKDPHIQVRYTTDGTEPNLKSKLYSHPFNINKTTTFKVRLFTTKGKPGTSYTINYTKQKYAPSYSGETLTDGLKVDWYDYKGDSCEKITTAKLLKSLTCSDISIPDGVKGNIGLVINGYIEVPNDDVYTFSLLSDDGSELKINGNLVLDNDGPHVPLEVSGQAALSKGLHPVAVKYFDHNGGVLKFSAKNSRGENVNVSFKH